MIHRVRPTLLGALAAGLLLTGCGGAGHHTPPPKQPTKAEAELDRALDASASPSARPARPDFKVPAAQVAGLAPTDLWEAVVLPMSDALVEVDSPARLHRALDAEQYAAYVVFLVEGEIENGGTSQLYFNSAGRFASEAVAALRALGAPRHAAVLERANRALWPTGRVPVSRAARQDADLDDPRLGRADTAWYAADDREGVDELVGRFIRAHPGSFLV